jgi:hypothetical protein
MFTFLSLAVTGANWAILVTKAIEFAERIKKEGYKVVKNDKPLAFQLLQIFPYFVITLIPVINFATLIGFIKMFGDEDFYEAYKQKLIEQGRIYKEEVSETEVVKARAKTDEKEEVLDKEQSEEVVRTYQDACNYWLDQQERKVPTLEFPEEDKSEEKGYQKTLKR